MDLRTEAGSREALGGVYPAASLPMFTADWRMPADGPQTVLKVLSTFKPAVRGAHIDLAKTYTTQFVEKAAK